MNALRASDGDGSVLSAARPGAARWHALAWGVVMCGILLRLRAYLADRSLWLDELFLWSALGEADVANALEPLHDGQVCAPGYLVMVQLLRQWLGDSESVLRLPSLVAGVAGCIGFWKLAARVLNGAGLLVAVALFSFGPEPIYYSSEFKPYSVDVLCGIAIVATGARASCDLTARSWALFSVTCLIAVATSLTALLVVGGVAAAGIVARPATGRLRVAGAAAAALAPAVALFALLHSTVLAPAAENVRLQVYWIEHGGLPPPDASVLELLAWSWRALVAAVANPLGCGQWWGGVGTLSYLAVGVLGVGAVAAWRRGTPIWISSALALPIALLVAGLGEYPFAARLALYLVPAMCLLAGLGIEVSSRRVAGRKTRALVALAAAAITTQQVVVSVGYAVRPRLREEARDVIGAVGARAGAGDVVVLTRWAAYGWRYYAGRYGLLHLHQVHVPEELDTAWGEVVDHAMERVPPADRYWFVASHLYPVDVERRRLRDALTARGLAPAAEFMAPCCVAIGVEAPARRSR